MLQNILCPPLDVHYLAAGTVYNPVVLFLGFVCESHVLWSPLSFLHLLCVQGPASCTLLPRCPCYLASEVQWRPWWEIRGLKEEKVQVFLPPLSAP